MECKFWVLSFRFWVIKKENNSYTFQALEVLGFELKKIGDESFGMAKSLIKDKSYYFALEIIGLYKTLLKQNEYVLSKQLLKSGTSIGANARPVKQLEVKCITHMYSKVQTI